MIARRASAGLWKRQWLGVSLALILLLTSGNWGSSPASAQSNQITVNAVEEDGALLPGACFMSRSIGDSFFGGFSYCDD